ncbi:MAG: hypothetical protein IPJ11_17025 [Gemmatimonadetes bacterium]|nr:hypothetical protein [Gemmatimonadota bacterium]
MDNMQQSQPEDRINLEAVRQIILGNDDAVVASFQTLCGPEIDRALDVLAAAYRDFQDRQDDVALTEQTATVQLFIHVALNSTMTSLHHLVHGHPIAAGHMMRHTMEAIAMAMLCAVPETGVYDRYDSDRSRFDVGSALHLVTQRKNAKALAESLGFDVEAWREVLKMIELFDDLSHASALSLGFHIKFTEEGGLVLGSEFDPAKSKEYESDVTRRRSAAESLQHVIPIIMGALPRRGGSPAAQQGLEGPDTSAHAL